MNKEHPVRNPDAVVRKEAEEALLFNPADGNMVCMNSTGMLIWDLCDGNNSREYIVNAILEKYEVDPAAAGSDYDEFIAELETAGLLGWKV